MGAMGFTTADRDAVRQALIDLATGKRVVSVDVAGKTRSFAATNIGALRELLSLILQDLDGGGRFDKVKFNAPT